MLILLLYPIIVAIIYSQLIVPSWGYLGFPYQNLETLLRNTLILEIAYISLYFLYLKTRKILFSDILLTIFMAIPVTSFVIQSNDENFGSSILVLASTILAYYLSRSLKYKLTFLDTISMRLKFKRRNIVYIIFILFLFLGLIFSFSELSLGELQLDDPSGNLFSAQGISNRHYINIFYYFYPLRRLYAYLICQLRYVIFPLLIFKSFQENNIIIYLVTIIYSFIFGLLGSTKIDIYVPIFVTFVCLITFSVGVKRLSFISIFKPIFFGLSSISFIFFLMPTFFTGIKAYLSVAIMRGFFIQGVIMNNYLSFFSVNQPIYMSHNSFLTKFYPYDDVLPRLIGRIYGGGRVNSNWISVEGFASFGHLIGPLISAVIVGVVLSFLNNAIFNYTFTYRSLALMYPLAIAFCDIPFTTSLTSGGILFFILISMQYPKSFGLLKDRNHSV